MPASHHLSPMALCVRLAAGAAQIVLAAAATVAVAASGLAALGWIPWLALPLALEGIAPVEAGPGVQIGLAIFLVTLCGFLPASNRVMRLETSHRRFHAGMEDVARAYYAAHAADRRGAFRFVNEFDAVRERLAFLRNHPELSSLEPEILELAAQMSHVGRDLARVYADDKVAAARELLAQRGNQATQIEEAATRATRVTAELVGRLSDVEDQEERATGRVAQLRTELHALLTQLGLGAELAGWAEPGAASALAAGDARRDDTTPAHPSIAVVRG